MPSNALRPGVRSILSDGNLVVPQTTEGGNSSILIVGFANNGPVNNPVQIGDATRAFASTARGALEANTLFGYIDSPATGRARLGAKFYEALRGTVSGTPDIRVMRLGTPTEANVDGQIRGDGRAYGILTAGDNDAIRLLGRWASTMYQSVFAKVDGSYLTLSYGGFQARFDLRAYATHTDLVNAINLHGTASEFVVAEVIESDPNAVISKERKASTGDLVIDTSIVELKTLQVVEEIKSSKNDRDLHGLIAGSLNTSGFDIQRMIVGQTPYDVYVSDIGTQTTTYTPSTSAGTSTFTSGDALVIPRYTDVNIRHFPYFFRNSNPYPGRSDNIADEEDSPANVGDSSLAFGANLHAGGGLAADNRADYDLRQLNVDIRKQFHSSFLGGIPVEKVQQLSFTNAAFDETDVHAGGVIGDYTTLTLDTSGQDVTIGRDDTATTVHGLVVTIPYGVPIPGGFYMGVHTGNSTAAGTLECWVWDPIGGSSGTGEWKQMGDTDDADQSVEVAGAVVDLTKTTQPFEASGIVGIKQYGRLQRIQRNTEWGGSLKFMFLTEDAGSLASTTSNLSLFSIIPLHPETFFQPEDGTTENGFDGITVKVNTNNRSAIDLQVFNWTKDTGVPDHPDISGMPEYSAYIYRGSLDGSAINISGNHIPPVITIRLGADGDEELQEVHTNYTVQCLSTQEAQTTAPVNNLNVISYDSNLNGAGDIQIGSQLRDFGFDSITSRFGARLILNGLNEDVYTYGYVAVDLNSGNDIFLSTGGVSPEEAGYVADRWKTTYTREAGVDSALAIQEGFLGDGLGGKNARDWSNMSNADKQMALGAALDNIDGDYPVDVVVLSQMYLDDVVETDQGTFNAGFHAILHDWLERQIADRHETMGVISVKPFDLGQITGSKKREYVNRLTNVNTGSNSAAAVMEAFNATMGCMSVTAGEAVFNGGITGGYTTTCEAAYAGLLTSIGIAQATTNKRIRGAARVRFGFTRTQQDLLMRHRYAVIDQDGSNGPVAVLDGVTAARNMGQFDRSDYIRLATVRTVYELMQSVRDVARPFIGQPNHPNVLQSLRFQVQKAVDVFSEAGFIVDGKSTVTANLADQVNGDVRITLDIRPAIEIRRITVTTSLRPELT